MTRNPCQDFCKLRFTGSASERRARCGAGETAWSRDEPPTGSFFPALLGHPDVVVLSGYADDQLVAGGIINRSASVVGLSNVFSRAADLAQAYAGCLAEIAHDFPGMPIVGYERGEALAAAHTHGFRSFGKLVVWLRE
jgi:hypothetical protein